mgnify:CR=1 FL=1
MLSNTAENLYYTLHNHPAYHTVNELMKKIMSQATVSCQLTEADGAYSNQRLVHYLLSLPEFDASAHGSFFQFLRCQNHATHLISIAAMTWVGDKLLAKMYGVAVFLRNLGYLMRLQLAVQEFLSEPWHNSRTRSSPVGQ